MVIIFHSVSCVKINYIPKMHILILRNFYFIQLWTPTIIWKSYTWKPKKERLNLHVPRVLLWCIMRLDKAVTIQMVESQKSWNIGPNIPDTCWKSLWGKAALANCMLMCSRLRKYPSYRRSYEEKKVFLWVCIQIILQLTWSTQL